MINQPIHTYLLAALFSCFLTTRAESQSWEQAKGIDSMSVISVAGWGNLLMAATDSVVFRSLDGGRSWHPAPAQPPSQLLLVLSTIEGVIYLGTIGDGIFSSADSGRSWSPQNDGMVGPALRAFAFAVRGDSLYVGTDGAGVFVRPRGSTGAWTGFSSGLTAVGTTSLQVFGEHLYATVGTGVFRRGAQSADWESVPSDSLGAAIPQTLFAHQGTLFLGTSGGVFKRSATDVHWVRADIRAFPRANIVAFAATGSRVYAGLNFRGDHWLWSSENDGAVWDIRSHEFATLFQLVVHQDRIWAARGDGLWSFPYSAWTSVVEKRQQVPQRPSLSEAYPSPFNPSTQLRYFLPRALNVNLRVHNMLGQEVALLVNGNMPAGTHVATWNAADMPSGVYFCRMTAEGITTTKRLVLAK
jgi:hypothetical protein